AARELTDAGVDVCVFMMPLVPGITTSQGSIHRTVEAIAAVGVKFGGANVAHLEDGVRAYFFDFLARAYPELLDGYARLYQRAYVPGDYREAIHAIVERARVSLRTAPV